jgi:hypothetical protein
MPGGGGSSGYATPDVLNNESFEGCSWHSFTNSAPPNPPSPSTPNGDGFSVNTSTDRAYQGACSAKVTFGANPDGDQAASLVYSFSNDTGYTIYARMYFYFTAIPNNLAHKWWRFQEAGFSPLGGTFITSSVDGGAVTWYDPDGCSGCTAIDIGTGVIPTGAWHSLEMEYDRSLYATLGNRVRFWYDGNVIIGTNSGSPNYGTGGAQAFWGNASGTPSGSGPWLYTGHAGTNIKIAAMDWDDTFNQGGTNSGSIYYDWIAVSSQRIGP